MVRNHSNAYDHLDPLLVEYTSVAADDPRRDLLLEKLVEGFLPLARNIARRFGGRGQPVEDLEQVATIGLLGALRRYDADRGRDFLSFAVPTIMGEVRRHFRDATWTIRTPRAIKERYVSVNAAIVRLGQDLNRAPTVPELADDLSLSHDEVMEAMAARGSLQPTSLDEHLTDSGDTSVADVLGEHDLGLDQVETRAMVHDLVRQLPSRERTILALRFVHDRTQSEIAEAVGISQMHVSRLLTRTLAQLREEIDREAEAFGPDLAAG